MEAINTQNGLLGSREGHEVCSKLSRQEKANTPFDLQSFEHDIFKSLSILLFLKYTKNIYYDREAWRAAIHGVAKSRTRLSN